MFEYAIGSNKGYRTTWRLAASWALSCAAHVGALLLVIQNPWLLQGGLHHNFRPLSLISGILSSADPSRDDNWRTVAVIRSSTPMQLPSPETLRKNIPDWNRPEASPSVKVRWGTDDLPVQETPGIQAPPKSEGSRREPDITLPQAGQSGGNPQGTNAIAGNSGLEATGPAPRIDISDAAAGRSGTIALPPPAPAAEARSAPKIVNDATAGAGPLAGTANNAAQVFDNEQQAMRSEGSGLFGNKGFPLGEYADLIIERVKGNWMIPSNLRKSQGRTTVIFFIDKEGRSADARIVVSSGSDSLDIAALSAILGSNPFPPLPKGFPGDRVGAKFVFSYNERQ